MHCNSNEVITGFHVGGYGCGGDKMKYKINCAAVTLKGETKKYPGCQLLDGVGIFIFIW